ncbi:MAG TPA: FtsX-like permease family protein, partial [Ohtaekwangia sp.]|nr:FtsX-like permease family protein [Ohtaekwangia sp.]
IFTRFNPSYPYSYHFVDDAYAAKFEQESLVQKLSGLFAVLAIVISCLGLFSLAAYMAERRTREIGIRKVLGSSIGQVWLLLSGEFFLLVLVSCVIASPVAFYYMREWLMQYDFRIVISPWIFLFSTALAMTVTAATVSFQALKAAMVNPVRSLQTE